MNLVDLRAQLEAELAWRQDEIRFFQNRGSQLPDEESHEQYRRALVLLLYAHFEGFCKFALVLYANTINVEGITCGEANYSIGAAGLATIFRELRDPNKKCPEFKNVLPDDAKLHRFARDREFVERTDDFLKTQVSIPEHVVDTESNLTPVVLRKNLFRLGFPHNQFEEFDGNINRLLAFRNRIAHGESRQGVDLRTYSDLRSVVFTIMQAVTIQVTNALAEKRFLRTYTPPTSATRTDQ